MGEKDSERPIYIDGKKIVPGGFPELNGQLFVHTDEGKLHVDRKVNDVVDAMIIVNDVFRKCMQNLFSFQSLLGREQSNNWRKLHGLPMRRKRWLRQ